MIKVERNEQYFALRMLHFLKEAPFVLFFYDHQRALTPRIIDRNIKNIFTIHISSRFKDLQNAIISISIIIISYVFACYNLLLELSLLAVVIQHITTPLRLYTSIHFALLARSRFAFELSEERKK